MKSFLPWISMLSFLSAAAFFGLTANRNVSGSSITYKGAPLHDLICNPERYNGGGVKTFGFVYERDHWGYVLVTQRERVVGDDIYSRITLVGSNVDSGSLPPGLSGSFVYVQGVFVARGIGADAPGTYERTIRVTAIESLEAFEETKENE